MFYTQVPIEQRLQALHQLENVLVMQMVFRTISGPGEMLQALDLIGAGDRDRTGDIQLGKLTFCH